MKRNIIPLFLSTILLVTLAACGNESNVSALSSADSSASSSSAPFSSEKAEENGVVRGKVLADNGEMIIAGIIVEDDKGQTYRTFTNALGGYDIPLAPGKYKLTFTKGYEFSTLSKEVTVESLKKLYLQDVRLTQLSDSFAKGWIAGDLHQHTYYSDGQDSVPNLGLSNVSQGLYFGFLTDHNVARGISEWYNTKNFPVYTESNGASRYFSPFEGVEETTEFGHYQSLGVPLTFEKYDLELYSWERNSANVADITKARISYIADSIKRAGGVAQINHPYSVSTMGFNYWELADQFETMEIWNGVFAPLDGRYETDGQNYKSKMKWFELLNKGLYLAATGGTDNHDVQSPGTVNGIKIADVKDYQSYYNYYDNGGKYSGMPTTYLNLTDRSKENVLKAIKGGHSFISNGPVVISKIGDKTYGEKVTLSASGEATITNDIFNRDGMDFIKIVKNGEELQRITLDNPTSYKEDIKLTGLKAGDWIVLEVSGPGAEYAITNPFFFE